MNQTQAKTTATHTQVSPMLHLSADHTPLIHLVPLYLTVSVGWPRFGHGSLAHPTGT
jgi:hypothetical protein